MNQPCSVIWSVVMCSLDLDGFSIEFPHQPYECQLNYMRQLLHALQHANHAILESPTGTGKTLCLLCTSLAWLTKTNNTKDQTDADGMNTSADLFGGSLNPSKIIFASRTHSQLSQAVQVLKRTSYSRRNISVIGSRDQLCLLPDVTALESNSAKIFACRARVQTRTCEYYRNFEFKRDNLINTVKADGVVDIEDLVKVGKNSRCCPYYMSRELKSNAEIVFMPYNYLLDPKIRRLYNIDLENAAVIFDEAHNIEKVCEDAASVTLSSSVLAAAIEYIRVVCEVVFSLMSSDGESASAMSQDLSTFDITRSGEDKLSSLNLDRLLTLKGQLIELERLVDCLGMTDDGLTKDSNFLFDLLGRAGFTAQTKEYFLQTIEDILSVAAAAENPKLRKPKGVNEISEFIKTVFDSKHAATLCNTSSFAYHTVVDYSRCYRVFVKDEPLGTKFSVNRGSTGVWDAQPTTSSNAVDRKLSYWCLSPGRAMQDLIKERVRCVILTSGTLYPVEPIEAELRIQFPVKLQNPHVIKADQVRVAVITHGRDGETLNSSYNSRNNANYRKSLGSTLVEIARVVPNGLLVFFPSYAMMAQFVESWKDDHIYNQLLQFKRIFIEPRDKLQFPKVFADYRDVASGKVPCDVNGAALFAVMRGRASEGLDLADFAGRGVAVLGLPYPPFHDPRVRLKMAYLDEQQAETANQVSRISKGGDAVVKPSISTYPTGRKWYNQQAWRAVNQSIGRVIRHHRDFGSIFLCDERFASSQARSQLPHWMQSNITVYKDSATLLQDTIRFYRDASLKYPPVMATGHTSTDPYPAERPSSDSNSNRYRKSALTDNQLSFKDCIPNMRKANEMKTFTNSLAPAPYSKDNENILSNYGQSNEAQCEADSSVPEPTLFTSIDICSTRTVHPLSRELDSDEIDDGELESKLLQKKPVKRFKLCRPEVKTDQAPFASPVAYIQAVKSFLNSDQVNHIQSKPLGTLKKALEAYRTTSSSNSSDLTCVTQLFQNLSAIFCTKESYRFVSGASCFLGSTHREYFQTLCQQEQTEVFSDKTNLLPSSDTKPDAADVPKNEPQVVCSKCNARPAHIPLISSCKHVACFGCWRSIIEEGNRRCPVCQMLVRRRNLTRLVLRADS